MILQCVFLNKKIGRLELWARDMSPQTFLYHDVSVHVCPVQYSCIIMSEGEVGAARKYENVFRYMCTCTCETSGGGRKGKGVEQGVHSCLQNMYMYLLSCTVWSSKQLVPPLKVSTCTCTYTCTCICWHVYICTVLFTQP